MPSGANSKREREYDELKHRFKEEHRYAGREDEVAARIVNKQRRQFGETKEQRRKDRQGKSPDRGLPISDYQHLTVGQIKDRLEGCSQKQLEQIRDYERNHKSRKTLLQELQRRI